MNWHMPQRRVSIARSAPFSFLLKILFQGCCVVGITFQIHAQGYIVANGVTPANFSGVSAFHVLQNPTNGNYTGFVFIPQTVSAFLFDAFADESVRVFFVSLNQPVSLEAISANSYVELIPSPSTIHPFANLSSFYVGLYTGATVPQNGIYNDPLFGWAQLRNNNGTIQLLGGALEYGGGGIYAGTQNIIPVPEPSTFALTGIGVVLLGIFSRKKPQRNIQSK